jgi:YacP-like NYN domain
MPYFLDGNNLIGHALGASRPSEENRRSLVAEVADRLRQTQAKAVLFFDGPGEKRTSLGSLSIRECGATNADDAILREIERSPAPRDIIVVTADRELGRRARDSGAKALSPGDFWSRFGVSRAPAPAAPTGKVDVDDWLQWFEDDTNRDR